MKNLHVAALATLFGLSAFSGLFVSTTAVASADQGDRGQRQRGQNRNNNGNWQYNQNGQCNNNGRMHRGDNDNDNDDNDRDDQDRGNNGNRGAGHGQKRGWQNPRNPHFCGYNNGQNCNNGQYGQYGQNGQYGQYPYGQNGQYPYGQNGQYGQYNCAPNGSSQGNAVIRGTITSVNGNQVTLMQGFNQSITINDQPALNNQQTGRVVPGRYVTAYGYYQNGIFYATSMQ
jgi:hypothetical protein